jgi:hypothetical protein
MEEEFIQNQELLVPDSSQENKDEQDRTMVDDLRGTPMAVGTCEEIIDDDHAIISTSSGPEFYVSIMSFVDKDLLEPGCTVLLHHKTQAIVGVLQDDADPMVNVMKLDKAPTESYADIGGLDQQIQEIKVRSYWSDADGIELMKVYRNLSNYPSHTPNCTKKWASDLQRASSFTASQEQARHSWQKRSRIKHPLPSSGS